MVDAANKSAKNNLKRLQDAIKELTGENYDHRQSLITESHLDLSNRTNLSLARHNVHDNTKPDLFNSSYFLFLNIIRIIGLKMEIRYYQTCVYHTSFDMIIDRHLYKKYPIKV